MSRTTMASRYLTVFLALAFATAPHGQTVSTDSASLAKDSAIVGDSTAASAPVPEAEPQQEQTSPDTSASELPFSLFSYPKILSIGVSLSWLYYSEEVDMVEVRNAFFNNY